MRIYFYRYNSIYEPDCIEAFKKFGIDVFEENAEILNKSLSQEERIDLAAKRLLDAVDELKDLHTLITDSIIEDPPLSVRDGDFIKDGVNYLGHYDPSKGTVNMGLKASKTAYPKVFKVHDGYAYSVSYDSYRNQGVINRVRLDQPSR